MFSALADGFFSLCRKEVSDPKLTADISWLRCSMYGVEMLCSGGVNATHPPVANIHTLYFCNVAVQRLLFYIVMLVAASTTGNSKGNIYDERVGRVGRDHTRQGHLLTPFEFLLKLVCWMGKDGQ